MTTDSLATSLGLTLGSLSLGAVFGLDAQSILAGAAGSYVSLGYAPQTSRLRAMAMFASVALVCASIGEAAAHHWFADEKVYRLMVSAVVGALFHPLRAGVVTIIPGLAAIYAKRTEK